ncbi:hypothetical protein TREES_T100002949 [Tupaia chinensis]|uniref:Uncharacterized protein n=1 Tax=Tupaia chinensis TaxID=246437 RepID=L9KXJ3_TUPCH|nr:hypothetical protein TREES_T100002949 [Tupaia chinensis]
MLRHAEASAIVEYAYNDKAILEQRNMLTEELYGNTFQLYNKAKYSRNIVKKFLMYGSKPQIAEIIRSFKGHVWKMLQHTEVSTIMEYAYNDKAIWNRGTC